ncbi:hypothetical protein SFUMM280S_03093 [Streptomyces fumanus]
MHCSVPSDRVPRSTPCTAATASYADRTCASTRRASSSSARPASVSVTRRVVRTEQRCAQLPLQRPHRRRQAGLGDQQAFRRPGEVLVLGDRDEVLEMAQFHD